MQLYSRRDIFCEFLAGMQDSSVQGMQGIEEAGVGREGQERAGAGRGRGTRTHTRARANMRGI